MIHKYNPFEDRDEFLTGRERNVIGVGAAILGSAAIGAASGYFGSQGRGGGGTTSSAPWGPTQNYILGYTPGEGGQTGTGLLPEARRLYEGGPQQYYGGNQVAGFNPYQQQALGMQAQRGMYGSPVTQGAQAGAQATMGGQYFGQDPSSQYLSGIAGGQNVNPAMGMTQRTAEGGFLGGSPYLDETFGRASEAVSKRFQETIAPGIAGRAVQGGRYGSPAYQRQQEGAQRALGESLGGMATDIYGGSYQRERGFQEQAQARLGGQYAQGVGQQIGAAGQIGGQYAGERGRQMQAMGMAPGLAQQDYADISQLYGAGQAYQGLEQQNIGADMAKFNFEQQAPWTNLQNYQGAIQGNYGGQQTTPSYGGNPMAGAAGGAMAGMGMYNMYQQSQKPQYNPMAQQTYGGGYQGGQQPMWNQSAPYQPYGYGDY